MLEEGKVTRAREEIEGIVGSVIAERQELKNRQLEEEKRRKEEEKRQEEEEKRQKEEENRQQEEKIAAEEIEKLQRCEEEQEMLEDLYREFEPYCKV